MYIVSYDFSGSDDAVIFFQANLIVNHPHGPSLARNVQKGGHKTLNKTKSQFLPNLICRLYL